MELPKGFHPLKDGFRVPFQPNDVMVGKYTLISTFGRMEHEEVAARYIIACQEVNVWAGVELSFLVDRAQEEWQEWTTSQRKQAENWEKNEDEAERYRKQMIRWSLKILLTLGLYSFFGVRPNPPVYRRIEGPSIMSGLFMVGPKFIEIGLSGLSTHGHILIERIDDTPVLFPTESFFDPIKKYVRTVPQESAVVN